MGHHSLLFEWGGWPPAIHSLLLSSLLFGLSSAEVASASSFRAQQRFTDGDDNHRAAMNAAKDGPMKKSEENSEETTNPKKIRKQAAKSRSAALTIKMPPGTLERIEKQ